MKKTTVIIIIIMLALLALGCQKQAQETAIEEPAAAEEPAKTADPDLGKGEVVEKRGQTTNITELEELKLRASKIQSFRYTLADSDEEYEYRILGRGRFFRIDLPVALASETGDPFDQVLLERTTKTALARCSLNTCEEKDMELEKVDYSAFYKTDMIEHMYSLFDGVYVGEEMMGDNYIKVFDIKYLTRPGKAWIQEYWGFPLKIEYQKEDGSTRTIEFKNLTIDNVRIGEIQIPFNCTVKGDPKHWWMWEHYLGEYPKKGQQMTLGPDGQPMYGV